MNLREKVTRSIHDCSAAFWPTLSLQQIEVNWKRKISRKYNAFKMSFFTNRFDIQIDLVKNKSLQISSRLQRSIREVNFS